MDRPIKTLFIGDIVGEPGIQIVERVLPSLIEEQKLDFIIINGENSHEGMGINEQIVQRLYDAGADVITGGNHSFAKWKIFGYMKTDQKLLRPLNYPRGAHGYGFGVYPIGDTGLNMGVINMQGRTFMPDIDCPFQKMDWVLEKISEESDIIFIDFHAEATAEKMAMGWYVDGRASALIGTHTHIPTSDARILPEGLGYMTDSGMTGPYDSVLGMDKETAIKRFKLATPHKYRLANNDVRMCGTYLDFDPSSGKCVRIEPLLYPSFNQVANGSSS